MLDAGRPGFAHRGSCADGATAAVVVVAAVAVYPVFAAPDSSNLGDPTANPWVVLVTEGGGRAGCE